MKYTNEELAALRASWLERSKRGESIPDQVRTYHGKATGAIVSGDIHISTKTIGEEQLLIQWVFPDGRVSRTHWAPRVLVPADMNRDDDPEFVFVVQDGNQKGWLSPYGALVTTGDEEPKRPGFDITMIGFGQALIEKK